MPLGESEEELKETTEEHEQNKDDIVNVPVFSDTTKDPEQPATSKKKWTTREIFTIVTLCIAGLSVGIFYGMLGPFFPQEAAKKGMSSTLIGVIFSAYELFIVLTSPLYGAYLTKIGAKHLYIMGLVISGGSALLFGMLEYCPPGTIYAVMCIVIRSVEACGTAGYLTASYAIMVNTFPDRVASMMGTLTLFLGLGFSVGAPLGGALFKAGGFKTPFIFTGSINITIGLLCLCILPSQKAIQQPGGSKMLTMIKMPVVLLMVVAVSAFYACISLVNVALSLRVAEVYRFEPAIIGLICLVFPGVYAVTTSLWGYLCDKMPRYSILFILTAFLITGISFIFMGPAPFVPIPDNILWLLLITLGMLGFSVGSTVPAFHVMSSAAVDSGMPRNLDTYGVVSGLYTMSFSIGGLLGPILAGYLIDTVQFQWTTFIFGCMMFAYAHILLLYELVTCKCHKSPQIALFDAEKEETLYLVTRDREYETTVDKQTSYGGMEG